MMLFLPRHLHTLQLHGRGDKTTEQGIFSDLIAGFCTSQGRVSLVLGTLSPSSIDPKHLMTILEALQSNFSLHRNKPGLTDMT